MVRKTLSDLHVAIKDGKIDVVKDLLEKKVDLHEKNRSSNPPLHAAIRKKNFEIVKILIEYGADVNGEGESGKPPLHIALGYRSRQTMDIVKLLLSKGAIYQEQNIFQVLDSQRLVKYFLENGASINLIRDKSYMITVMDNCAYYKGCTPLHIVARGGKLNMVKLLLKNGAEINARNIEHMTPLQFLLLNGLYDDEKKEIAKYLIEQGADVNLVDEKMKSLLHFAVYRGYFDVAKCMVRNGANVNAKDCNNVTPLHELFMYRFYIFGDINIFIEFLVQNGAHVNAQDKWGFAPIHFAIRKGYIHELRQLLKLGADPCIKTFEIDGRKGRSALQIAKNVMVIT